MKHDYPIVITEPDFVRLFGLNTTQSLATKLNTAVVLRSGPIPPDLVTVNSTILYEDEYTGARRKITIVYPPDADPSKGNVSVLTPVGTALLGLSIGQSTVWPFPDGSMRTLHVMPVEVF